ncbi:MAG: TetR/AcrR family transcriptional regulator [Hyphomicrobiales bacterium]|nr:TetR/AcrR family transcriptional regulator [Hyphomicrobiales bacterium]
MGGDVKQRMIEQTALSLARRGLQRTSFSEVLEASGAPRGSLYHHFPGGKDELVAKAVAAAGAFALAHLESLRGQPADKVAAGFIGLWRALLTRSDFGAGCAAAAVTVAAETPDLLRAAAVAFAGWRALLATLLHEGGVPEKRAQALAATLIAACEGAVILARADHALEPFDLVANEQIAMTKAAIAVPARNAKRKT